MKPLNTHSVIRMVSSCHSPPTRPAGQLQGEQPYLQHQRISVTCCLCRHEDCMQSSSRQGNLYKISTSCPLVRSCNKKVKCLSFCGLTYLLPLKEEQKMKNVFQERKEKCRQKVKITLADINGLTAYLISSRQMILSSCSMQRIGDFAGQRRRLGRAPPSHQHTTQ